jgi:hypothetical protein
MYINKNPPSFKNVGIHKIKCNYNIFYLYKINIHLRYKKHISEITILKIISYQYILDNNKE